MRLYPKLVPIIAREVIQRLSAEHDIEVEAIRASDAFSIAAHSSRRFLMVRPSPAIVRVLTRSQGSTGRGGSTGSDPSSEQPTRRTASRVDRPIMEAPAS